MANKVQIWRDYSYVTPLIVWTLGALGAWAIFPTSTGLFPVLRVTVALVLGAFIPGLGLLRLLKANCSIGESLAFGTGFGLMLWALGSFAASATGQDHLRWLPTVLALFLWILPQVRKSPALVANRKSSAVFLGALFGSIAMIPALVTTLRVQRSDWSGWWAFNVDLPFHISLAAETGMRAGSVYPYVSDTDLRYTWLSNGAMGTWSRLSRVPNFEFFLQHWPIFIVIFLPLTISALVWRLTQNSLATILAPIIGAVIHGPLIAENTYLSTQALAPYSPSRDMSTLWLCALIFTFLLCESKNPAGYLVKLTQYISLFFVSFCLAGCKGSFTPISLGALCLAFVFYKLKSRTWFPSLYLVVAIVLGQIAAQVLIVKSSGNVLIQPLSVTDAIPDVTTSWSLLWAISLLFLGLGIFVYLRVSSLDLSLSFGFLTALPLSGAIGIILVGHPGKSQLYFLSTSMPFIGISLAIIIAHIGTLANRSLYLRTTLISIFLAYVAWQSTSTWTMSDRAILLSMIALVAGAFLAATLTRGARGQYSYAAALGIFLLSPIVLYNFSISQGSNFDTGPSSQNSAAVHSDQLQALTWLRENTSPDEFFITNKHCIAGSISNNDCYGRWFMASAISERRTPIEGFSYTWRNADGPYWNSDLLTVLDGFISSPSQQVHSDLVNAKINWVYIDTSEPYSDEIKDFGSIVFDSEFAKVYSLNP